MQWILETIQVHVPFRLLTTELLHTIVEERINPEISFNYMDLENTSQTVFLDVAKRIAEAELSVTFHAPFMDLRPGAIDPKIRQVTRDRLNQVFDLAPYFHPLTVVCHPSFDERYYISNKKIWLENSIEIWRYFLQKAEIMNTIITLENVYEADPLPLAQLLDSLETDRIRFCFDTGHFNVFSRSSLETWVKKLGPYLAQLHIHDNNGSADEHSPMGAGSFPFAIFFDLLQQQNLSPLITLEPHKIEDLWETLQNTKMMDLLKRNSIGRQIYMRELPL